MGKDNCVSIMTTDPSAAKAAARPSASNDNGGTRSHLQDMVADLVALNLSMQEQLHDLQEMVHGGSLLEPRLTQIATELRHIRIWMEQQRRSRGHTELLRLNCCCNEARGELKRTSSDNSELATVTEAPPPFVRQLLPERCSSCPEIRALIDDDSGPDRSFTASPPRTWPRKRVLTAGKRKFQNGRGTRADNGDGAKHEEDLYLLPYESVDELAVVMDRLVQAGLRLKLVVSRPDPKLPLPTSMLDSLRFQSDRFVHVAALPSRLRFYHRFFAAYYGGNKWRNQLVREDLPRAKEEQDRETEEAAAIRALYDKMLQEQQERDAEVARKVAEELEQEEEERRRIQAIRDEQLAKRMQRAAVRSKEREERNRRREHAMAAPPFSSTALDDPLDNQETLDEELARRLQAEEGVDPGLQDRLLAIEVQDRELARMLQEKEQARLQRAKERAKRKALAKKEELEGNQPHTSHAGGASGDPSTSSQGRTDKREKELRTNWDAIEVEKSAESEPQHVRSLHAHSPIPNVAMSIDPTFHRHSPSPAPVPYLHHQHLEQVGSRTRGASLPSVPPPQTLLYLEDEGDAPPYMPIAGQRRTASWERKKKPFKSKESCKQQ